MISDSNRITYVLEEMKRQYSNKKIIPCLRGWKKNDRDIDLKEEDIAAAVKAKVNGFSIFTYESASYELTSSKTKSK